MWMYVYMCHTYIRKCIYVCIYVYIYVYVYVHMHMSVYTYYSLHKCIIITPTLEGTRRYTLDLWVLSSTISRSDLDFETLDPQGYHIKSLLCITVSSSSSLSHLRGKKVEK